MLFLYILLLIYIYIICKNIVSLIYADHMLRKSKHMIYQDKYDQLVYLIIPMLNEQEIANYTYSNFKKIVDEMDNVHTVFVTTSKELREENKETTYEILDRLTKNDSRMFVYNYEQKNGVMAHQINYALQIIAKENKKNDNILIGIYNADSEIDTNSIKYVLNMEKNKPCDKKTCYQQYSWYKINNNCSIKSIISSASIWQTRWSLTFEIFRVKQQQILNQFLGKNCKIHNNMNKVLYILFEKMNYVIGHGFYINLDLIQKLGNFPEDTINEDAYLGYIINNENIEINVIPYLEKAEFVPRTSIYIKQQATWVNGPIYAFQYFRFFLKNRKLKTSEKIRAFLLAFKLFLHFIYWLISPYLLLFVLPFLLIKYYSWIGLIISACIIFLELPFTHYMVRKVILRNIKDDSNEFAKPSIFCIPFFLIHSFGPILNIFMQLIGKNNKENKYKTERK